MIIDGKVQHEQARKWSKPIIDALEDDLNTPLALAELHKAARIIHFYDHESRSQDNRATRQEVLRIGGTLMGLLQLDPMEWRQGGVGTTPGHVEKRLAERAQARKERRFADADRIRAELAKEGIILEDKPDGTTAWRGE